MMGWDAGLAFEVLFAMDIEMKPEPPKVYEYKIKKYCEKEAFKRIEEDPINSTILLGKIKVKKVAKMK